MIALLWTNINDYFNRRAGEMQIVAANWYIPTSIKTNDVNLFKKVK